MKYFYKKALQIQVSTFFPAAVISIAVGKIPAVLALRTDVTS